MRNIGKDAKAFDEKGRSSDARLDWLENKIRNLTVAAPAGTDYSSEIHELAQFIAELENSVLLLAARVRFLEQQQDYDGEEIAAQLVS